MTSTHKLNRLAQEKSPYLLQHAANPVDWYPWGEEAFKRAREENKLIFLSIGYSTCHWCHVMERESFENPKVAALLNQDYISIKVDREERPDIDHIYMSAIQAMTGAGGWPLTVFMTPDAKPVTGGTYFPPEDKWGRMGMMSVLPHLAGLWKTEAEKMRAAGAQMTELLQAKAQGSEASFDAGKIFEAANRQFRNSFDEVYGGFGGAPKFPRSHDLSFLLRSWKKNSDAQALVMVEKTLQAMAWGGIYDHLGGGFARYATDENWLVPHFEKMLYDQAILARTYLEAFHATGNFFYADVAKDIFRYVLRDMTSPEGGFFSAEDADSEGEEGKFYVWRPEEMVEILGASDAALFMEFYGVTEEGNFEHAASILHKTRTEEAFAAEKKIEAAGLKQKFKEMRDKLFSVREKRIHPHKDKKILTSWNAMMISALAYGAQILEELSYQAAAVKAAEFILTKVQKGGRLLRRYCEGEAAILGFQDDYAFFVNALLDLYETTFDVKYLEEAIRLVKEMDRLFADEKQGGFYYSGSDGEALIARTKEFYDGAVPSGNSTAALAMLRLARMTGDASSEQKVQSLIRANAAALTQHPVAFSQMLSVIDFFNTAGCEIVFAGDPAHPDSQEFLKAVRGVFDPNRVMLRHPEKGDAPKIEKIADFIKNQKAVQGQPAVYVCRNRVCQLPATSLEALKKLL